MEKETSTKYLGITAASFIIFGCLPLYWAFFRHVDSYTVLFHRCMWTFFTLLPFVFHKSDYKAIFSALKTRWVYVLLSTFFIGTNWFTYIYAVNNHHIFEASLAYFISPLITILLGFLILKESISRKQFIALVLVFGALTYLLISKGIFPKYALIIACSFSFYGFVGRKIYFSSVVKMLLESFLICVIFILFFQSPKEICQDFFLCSAETRFFLVLSGAITVIPLMLLTIGLKHIPFSTVGIISFILPSIVFLLGIFYFNEQIDREKIIAISLIWLAVGLYIYDLRSQKRVSAL